MTKSFLDSLGWVYDLVEGMRVKLRTKRRNIMEKKSPTQLALIGVVLSLPAALIVVTGLAQGLLGFHQLNDALDAAFEKVSVLRALIHPVVVVGGLLTALGLNALSVLKFTFVPEDGTLVGVLGRRIDF